MAEAGAAAPLPLSLSLSELIDRTGVPASTIHHYRRAGLLPVATRGPGRRLRYDDSHVEALSLIRGLREERGLSLDQIGEVLPSLLNRSPVAGWPPPEAAVCLPVDARQRAVGAAIEQFSARSYAEVTMAEVAAAAGMAKGSVYRYFASKEDLFLAVVETLMAETASAFAAAVEAAGGPAGIAVAGDKAAIAFAGVVARAMPILLELGARAAKGHQPSRDLARRVLVTMAEAAGRPLADSEPVPAGVALIEQAFSVMLRWSVGDSWPDVVPLGAPRSGHDPHA